MANFGESRFLGLSSRAIVLTLVVTAIVVGLFFMPPAIKFLFEDSNKSVKTKSSSTTVASAPQGSNQKAALNADKLQQVSSDITAMGQKPAAKTPSKKVDNSDGGGGFFSGWNFKVKASGAGDSPGVQIPAGLSIRFTPACAKCRPVRDWPCCCSIRPSALGGGSMPGSGRMARRRR